MKPLESLDPAHFDTPAILKKLAASSRRLAELKGIAASIPNQGILINTLGLQEAKDSSEIENIVTTHDELLKDDVNPEDFANPAAKEVMQSLGRLGAVHAGCGRDHRAATHEHLFLVTPQRFE